MFEARSLPDTEDVIFKWRLLVEEGRKTGHTFSQPDLIIAATALCHGLTVLSRDTSDYERARVPVVESTAVSFRRGRKSRCARRAETIGAILREAHGGTVWTLGRGPRGFTTSDPQISRMRSAGQLSSFCIGAAPDPISASKIDPKRHRTRSKVNDRAHTSPMIEAALIGPTWSSPDDDVAVDLASAGVLNEDKRHAS